MFEARGVGVPHQPDGHETATRGAGEKLPGCAGGLSQSPGATGSGVNTRRLLLERAGKDWPRHTYTLFYCIVSSFTKGLNLTHAFVTCVIDRQWSVIHMMSALVYCEDEL